MGEASPVCPGEWPLTFPRTEGGGRSPPHGGARAGQGVVAGKKRKVRRAAVKAVFLPTRQAALPRLPLEPNARRCQGRDERCGPRAGLNAGCMAAEKDKRFLENQFNVVASELMSVNRTLPDYRHAQ